MARDSCSLWSGSLAASARGAGIVSLSAASGEVWAGSQPARPYGSFLRVPRLGANKSSCGVFLPDRTRSRFSGLLGPLWAVLGLPKCSGKSPKAPDFARESSTFPVSESEFRGRFNSPRLHQNPLGDKSLLPKTPRGVPVRGAGSFAELAKNIRIASWDGYS